MNGTRNWLSAILVCIFVQTVYSQCYEEPVRGTIVKASNKLQSADSACFDNLRVDMTKCSVRVSSITSNCTWLSLLGGIGGISADSVLLAGPLTRNSSLRWFEMKVANGYAAIKLELLENRNRSIIYRVDQGRVFQLRAALPNNSNVTFGNSISVSGTALANCNTGAAAFRMVGVTRTCATFGSSSCLRTLGVQVSGCRVYVYAIGTAGEQKPWCPGFQGTIQGNGGSAIVAVQFSTLSQANPNATDPTADEPPPADPTDPGTGVANRRLLQGGRRALQQMSMFQNDQWLAASAGTMIKFSRLGCDLYFSMIYGRFLLNAA